MTGRILSVRLADAAVIALLAEPAPLLFVPVSPAPFQDSYDPDVWWFPADVPGGWRPFRDITVATAQMRRKFRAGDRVWVQECFAKVDASGADHVVTLGDGSRHGVRYRATWRGGATPWRSATQMLHADARIERSVRAVSVVRLFDVTVDDARRAGAPAWWEGLSYEASRAPGNFWTCAAIERGWEKTAPDWRGCFAALWAQTHGAVSWNANRWVYRLELGEASQ